MMTLICFSFRLFRNRSYPRADCHNRPRGVAPPPAPPRRARARRGGLRLVRGRARSRGGTQAAARAPRAPRAHDPVTETSQGSNQPHFPRRIRLLRSRGQRRPGETDGTLDAADDPPPLGRRRALGRRPRRVGRGHVGARPTCSRTASRCRARTRARGRAHPRGALRPDARPARSRSSRRASPVGAAGSCRPVRAAAERAAAELPTGRVASVAAGLGRGRRRRTIVSELEPADAKGYTDDMRAAAGTIPGARGLRHRPGGDRARPRPGVRRGPQGRRALHRHPDRAPDPRLRLRDARVPAAVPLRGRRDPDDARDHLDLRQLHGADDLPAEPRHADRARDRDRLLAARRLPLPRGASRRARPRTDAVVRTMATAGRAVVFSGTAVGDRPRAACSSCRCRSCAASASAGC